MKPRLYLDIDGVLNSKEGDKVAAKKRVEEHKKLNENLLKHKRLLHLFWSPPCVEALKKILTEVKPEIYIHSTWKHHFELDEFTEFFEHWGLDASLIRGIVPQYKFSSLRCNNLSWHIQGDRIMEDDTERCTNYVILDDENMTDYFQNVLKENRQIVTDDNIGLTMEQADEAIKLLRVD